MNFFPYLDIQLNPELQELPLEGRTRVGSTSINNIGNFSLLSSTVQGTVPFKSYFDYLYTCFMSHRPIVVSPDFLWFEVMAYIGLHVSKQANYYQSLFKINQKVFLEFDCAEAGQVNLEQMKDIAQPSYPFSLDLLVPTFSTTTPSAHMAFVACVVDIVTSLQKMRGGCGFPFVRLKGLPRDWEEFSSRILQLGDHFPLLKTYFVKISEITSSLALLSRSADQAKLAEFFRTMLYSNPALCDSQTATRNHLYGWILHFYNNDGVEKKDVPNLWSKILYTDIRTQEKIAYLAVYGLFSASTKEGVLEPEFSQGIYATSNESFVSSLKSGHGGYLKASALERLPTPGFWQQ